MNRPDTGTRTNMIMEMAASIIASKMEYCQLVADASRDAGKMAQQEAYLEKVREMSLALSIIDKNAGCWS
jgi:hypothetical protein